MEATSHIMSDAKHLHLVNCVTLVFIVMSTSNVNLVEETDTQKKHVGFHIIICGATSLQASPSILLCLSDLKVNFIQ